VWIYSFDLLSFTEIILWQIGHKITFGPDQNCSFFSAWGVKIKAACHSILTLTMILSCSLLITIPMDKMPSLNLSAPLAMSVTCLYLTGHMIAWVVFFCLSPWAECDNHLEIVNQEFEQYFLLWLLAIWKV